MNETEKEPSEKKEEEFKLESFDDFVASLEAEEEVDKLIEEQPLEEEGIDEELDLDLKRAKDGIIYLLKQLKATNEQRDFLIAFKDKYDLAPFITRVNETFDRFLVDFAVFQEENFDKLQTVFTEEPFLPEAFNFIFSETKKFEKYLTRKKRDTLYEIIRTTKNTELLVPDTILEFDRNKPLFRKEIKFIKEQLDKRDLRLKKVKKVAPNLKDVIAKIEGERLVDISMLIYYYYKLTNEDVETDKGLGKIFPEITEAHKKIEELEQELKKNQQNDRTGKNKKKTAKKKTRKETQTEKVTKPERGKKQK